jgi:hypothetical protein
MKWLKPCRLVAAFFIAILITTTLSAQVPDRNAIPNWPAPATWSPSATGGGLHTMTDISSAIPFVATFPCRIADTRGLGFTGQAGPPILDTGIRTFQVTGTVPGLPSQCGIPTGADAVSFQLTIVSPNTNGNLIAWPAGGPIPTISVLNWSAGETALGNGTIVPLSNGGAISVRINAAIGSAVGHLVIDVNGYFSDDLPTGQLFEVAGSRNGPVILAENASPGPAAYAIRGLLTSASSPSGSAAVHGAIFGTGDNGSGVLGEHAGGSGVTGTAVTGIGVTAQSFSGTAVQAQTSATTGFTVGVRGSVFSSGADSSGLRGQAIATSGATNAVYGRNLSTSNDSAGVRGIADTPPNTASVTFSSAGVRGENKFGNGTIGISESTSVGGFLMDPGTGTAVAQGRLGTTFGTDPDGGGPPWAVHAIGNIGAAGTKAFLEPHPTEPGKVIQYVALEGPEAGTYFRGKARFQRGLATIRVPEDFRMVTDPDGLTVQITPIGEMATYAVVRMGLDGIVVKSSRDVEFSYLVQGVRASFRDMQPVIQDGTFVPQFPEAKIPGGLAERQKRILIETGMYRPDGTVNMETARRLGWDRMWEKKSSPARDVPVE